MPAKIMECRSPSLVIDSAQHKAQHRAQHACQIACNVADMTFLAEACWQIFVESHRQRMRRLPNSWTEQAAVQVSNQIDCSEQARVVLSHPQDSGQKPAPDTGHDCFPDTPNKFFCSCL